MITCNEYDYIEIVCLFRYPVELKLKSGEIRMGVGLDTQRNEKKQECIKLDANGSELLVVLDEIAELTVCIENPHFDKVQFH